ncbi:MAG: hypothetical protein ACLVHH_09130 [Faecalibacillus intestinalis]
MKTIAIVATGGTLLVLEKTPLQHIMQEKLILISIIETPRNQ